MANPRNRVPENVVGDFFVDATCIDCDAYQERFLFTGDHLAWDRSTRRLRAFRDYCWYSWTQQAESMARLAAYRFEWVLPGHGQRVRLPAAEMRREIKGLAESMSSSRRA
jgi:glyoxylase-like metal-dependent hydrolase (beta-lactamase superfamily II)